VIVSPPCGALKDYLTINKKSMKTNYVATQLYLNV